MGEIFFEKRFGGKEKSCTFASFQQEQHLFKVAKLLFNNISVKVSYSSNAIQTKSVSSCWNNTHSRIFYFYLMFQQEKTTVDTMPVVEALYPKKAQPRSRKGWLDTLYEEVAKEYFQEILQEAHGECVVKVGSKKNGKTGQVTDEWRVSALCQEGKGRTFAKAVIALYGAITHAKTKKGGVL